jgi:hypothetical protein
MNRTATTPPPPKVGHLGPVLHFGAMLAAPFAASAHEGHGLPGARHWHATDAFGLVLVVVAAAALLWWRGRR